MALANLKAPIHKNRTTTMGKISGFYQTGKIFSPINLSSKMYDDSRGYSGELLHFPILGPHGTWKDFSYEDIKAGPWIPAQVGNRFGPMWTTHWFHIKFDVPTEWTGKEVHFRWNSGSEAMIHDIEFNVLQGLGPQDRGEYIISKSWTPSQGPLEYYIEMACSDMFGGGNGDMIAPPDNNRHYTLQNADIAVFNRDNFNLTVDFDQINGIAEQLSTTHVGYQAMFVANEMVNLLQVDKKAEAQALAAAFFAEGNGAKAHTLYAMGHCHIDTAWLWPYDETIRKCARSFSAQLELMDEYPGEYTFVCSSAQQYVYVQEHYPSLYERIKAKVAEGTFMPVGGTWIEMDGNIPSGEGFMRQYYYGQKFFEKEFGILCKEFWLPDTFGYSAQIPQMLKHVGIERFLTQKMSWSLVNKFPNHNFWWEGIDGTEVLVHFPPGDSYNMNGLVHEVLNSQNNSLDKGRANCGVYLYGYGDGGGGPTRRMIERLRRIQDVDGLPKVKFSDSNEFFDELAKDSHKFYKWVGELYLELHNGTYTSQARIKWYNRKGEFLFREVELLMAMAYAMRRASEIQIVADMEIVDKCWQDFLLNQFHDVLPGSCLEFCAIDAWEIYGNLFTRLMQLRSLYHTRILGAPGANFAILNTLPWSSRSVVFMKPDAGNPPTGTNTQSVTLDAAPFEDQVEGRFRIPHTFSAALVNLEASGYSQFLALAPSTAVTFAAGIGPLFGTYTNGLITLEVRVDDGRPVESLFFDGSNRLQAFDDYLNKGVDPGMFYIYDDIPLYWDAWDVMDYHLESRRLPDYSDVSALEGFGNGPIVGGYKWKASFGNGSTITRYAIIRAESPMVEYYSIVDWHEDHKMLKVEWPANVLSRDATFEIQYGHAQRPTHINTSWDMAMFEVCGHKWMDISQADKGVTIISDSKYGWHVRDNHIQLSLLKSPKNPDGNCDMHKHYIYYAVLPHKGSFQGAEVIQRAYELNTLGSNNVPIIPTGLTGATMPRDFVRSSHAAVVVEAVKVSKAFETTMNTICVRLYESHGGYAETEISFDGFTVTNMRESNGLEQDIGAVVPVVGNKFAATFKPFQIQTFLVTFT